MPLQLLSHPAVHDYPEALLLVIFLGVVVREAGLAIPPFLRKELAAEIFEDLPVAGDRKLDGAGHRTANLTRREELRQSRRS